MQDPASLAANPPAAESAGWQSLVPARQWQSIQEVHDLLQRAGVSALLGGAFAFARHAGHWRATKDVDFFLRPADRARAIEALLAAGYQDYYDKVAYDRSWIFRGHRPEELVDLIWTVPNHVTEVDEAWFEHGASIEHDGRRYATLPAEELIWIKLYVLQRDRCDWPDVLNLLRTLGAGLDWERLTARVGADAPLLKGVLTVLAWLSPECAQTLPAWVRERFQLELTARPDGEPERVRLLDSRPWYAALTPVEECLVP